MRHSPRLSKPSAGLSYGARIRELYTFPVLTYRSLLAAGASLAVALGSSVVAPVSDAMAAPAHTLVDAPSVTVAPIPLSVIDDDGWIATDERTHISVLYTASGRWEETANAHEIVPALSLIKLLIAEYVVRHSLGPGSLVDRETALDMVRASDDEAARELFEKYPTSIESVVAEENLRFTWVGKTWGTAVTTTGDMVRFIRAMKEENSPVIDAMESALPVAADGYKQDFGTATFPSVTGTKFGWSNDRESAHFTASIGEGFIVVASTAGSKDEHTADVTKAFAHHTCVISMDPRLWAYAPSSVAEAEREDHATYLLVPSTISEEKAEEFAKSVRLVQRTDGGECGQNELSILRVSPVISAPLKRANALVCGLDEQQVPTRSGLLVDP